MTADDMRKGVTFQTGLTGKAKLALLGAILAAIAITVWLVLFIRSRRLAAGKQPILDQATLDSFLALLKSIAASSDQQTPASK